MVGFVIVSHSRKLAEGVVELAKMMAPDVPQVAAGGLEDGSFGTSFERILEAVNEIYSEDGVIVLMDLGSAVMTTEMVIETFEGKKVEMVDCPLVEGAVVATIDSVGGMDFESIKKALAGVGTSRKF